MGSWIGIAFLVFFAAVAVFVLQPPAGWAEIRAQAKARRAAERERNRKQRVGGEAVTIPLSTDKGEEE